MSVIEIKGYIPRYADGIECQCGGHAEMVKCTKEELERYNCCRSYKCCARAFVCCVCGNRLVGEAEVPECNW